MLRIINTTLRKPVRQSIGASASFGGCPKKLVINQVTVFVFSETSGEVIKARVLEDFYTEQGIRLWVCNKG